MNLFFEHVLFSIDNWDKLRTSMRFEKYLDMKVATGDCKPVQKGIGKWRGRFEVSYLMDKRDYNKYVKDTHWVKNQECFAVIPGDVRQPVDVFYADYVEVRYPVRQDQWGSADEWVYMDGKYWRF
jgi:hypothetical protein